jgi:hypothetical protein
MKEDLPGQMELPLPEVPEYVRDRDAVMENGTVQNMLEFYKKHHPDAQIPSYQVAEIAFHKARTASTNISMQKRLISDAWLKNRGYSSFLD